MHDPGTLAKRYPVTVFYVLAFAISWAGYVPLMLRASGSSLFQSPLWFAGLALPAVGPAAAAWMTRWLMGERRSEGKSGAPLRRRPAEVGRHGLWWLVALTLPPVLLSLANGISVALWGRGRTGILAAPGRQVALILAVSLVANVWEEVGWRGFALVRLERRHSPWLSAAIVGVLWVAWHGPLLLPGAPMGTLALLPWSAATMSHSILLAWLFNRSGRSLGVVTLFHIAGNVFPNLLGVRSFGLFSVLEVATAVLLVAATKGRLGYDGSEPGSATC